MLLPWLSATVIDIQQLTEHTLSFVLEIGEGGRFDFIPGQFITFDLPISDQKNKRLRSYSIASAPDGTNRIELVIVRVEGGDGTRYLFEEVKVGSVLTLRGALGSFTLPKDLSNDIWLLCTGTGVAPFKSMLDYIHFHKLPYKSIHLVFGSRLLSDCLYREHFEGMAAVNPDFHYHLALSREVVSGNNIVHGYIHQVYEAMADRGSLFYLCGWRNMVDEARVRLEGMGVERKRVVFELYG